MKFFVDTNVIVDLILNRTPFNHSAARIFSKSESGEIELYTSTHAIATTHYLIKKFIRELALRKVLLQLLDLIKVVPVSEEILRKSLKSNHKDFEDAIQIFCAHQIRGIEAIITRNAKDFSTSEIKVLLPDQAVELL